MQRFAIYDMDKTITRRPTWTPFLIHAAARIAPWRLALLPVAGLAAIAYALRFIHRVQLKQTAHWLMLGPRCSAHKLAQVAESFADRIAAKGIFADALAQIARDRAAGHRLVIATASHSFYVHAIARRLGIDAVIATEARRAANGDILWLIDGDNCYGAGKLDRITGWLAAEGVARGEAHTLFYSDHVSDAPALGWADQGYVINADAVLLSLAESRGWVALDWH